VKLKLKMKTDMPEKPENFQICLPLVNYVPLAVIALMIGRMGTEPLGWELITAMVLCLVHHSRIMYHFGYDARAVETDIFLREKNAEMEKIESQKEK
jgi:hypothetical protein